jgi:UDP-glucose 4-epimerase
MVTEVRSAHRGRVLVTGGAGFIGSHVVDRLAAGGAEVVVYDNFSTGRHEYLAHHATNRAVRVIDGDVLDRDKLSHAMHGCTAVFHFQANADVRGGMANTRIDLEQNTIATWNVLESIRETGPQLIVFASSATVYGEPKQFPTPESYAPLHTSLYGASKLAGEAMIQAYGEYFGIRNFCFRFVSWIGERYSHGVIFDFMKKLRDSPHELEILGDGSQTKSYLDVEDGVAGIFAAIERSSATTNVFNLGHDECMNVKELAAIVVEELGLQDVRFRFTGGPRGWLGDSPVVRLDTTAIKQLGWMAKFPIETGVRRTVRYLRDNASLLSRR